MGGTHHGKARLNSNSLFPSSATLLGQASPSSRMPSPPLLLSFPFLPQVSVPVLRADKANVPSVGLCLAAGIFDCKQLVTGISFCSFSVLSQEDTQHRIPGNKWSKNTLHFICDSPIRQNPIPFTPALRKVPESVLSLHVGHKRVPRALEKPPEQLPKAGTFCRG